ncbi:putative lipid II flippase FtsW [Candidatus Desantisbacteria bacterium]|nr:putative lipid II flippase FtsW [Candidatus Desantisbacteria bacterium]
MNYSRARFDIILFLITITLVGIGVLMIYSSSAIFAQKFTQDSYFLFKKQILWICISSIGMLIAWKTDYKLLRKYKGIIIAVGLFLLILTIIPHVGYRIGGGTRWLKIVGLTFQPSELIKLCLILWMADFIVKRKAHLKSMLKGFLPALMFLLLIIAILLKQPHFGMIILLFSVSMVILFIGGINLKHMFFLLLVSIPALAFIAFKSPYRVRRLTIFLDPWSDAGDKGYHIIQSLIALGSGGLFGVGLGESKQKLFYLPESSTDFIFAIIGEEGGFIFATAVVLLFVGFAYCGTRICLATDDFFASLLAFSLTFIIVAQAFLNIGVVTGVLPTTGVPLPFISFGGSALVFNMVSVGILLNIAKGSFVRRG